MNTHVQWVLKLAVNEGKLDEFKALAAEMSEVTKAGEPGALAYEWFLSDDGATCHLYERYADSDATLTHLSNVKGGGYIDRLFALAKPTGITAYGAPDERVRKALAELGTTPMAPLAGFAR